MSKLFFGLILFSIVATKSLKTDSSEVRRTQINKLKLGIVSFGTVGLGVITYDYFNKVWWKPTKVKKFVLREDWNDLVRADKAGHFYFSYVLSDVYKNLFEWVGFNRKVSAFIGAGISVLYEVGVVELTDGFTTQWGFSPSDAVFDILGAFFPVAQEYFPQLKVITFKFSYTPSGYTWLDYLRVGSLKDALYKKQFHTDYEGMTFWMSFEFQGFFPDKIERIIPDFINLAIGYSVKEINYAGAGYSELYIAIDLNLLKFNTGIRFLDCLLRSLNYVHWPAPAIRIKPRPKFYYLHF